MGRISDILLRLARAASAVPPERAAVLLAAAHPPGLLVGFVLWVLENVAADVVLAVLLYPLLLRLWRRLTPGERRRLLELRDRLLPPAPDGDDVGAEGRPERPGRGPPSGE